MSSGVDGRPCGACRFLRRKCVSGCVFAPYFEGDQDGAAHFAAVHKVFGASNSSKLLLRLPPHKRLDAVISLCYEALARLRDPVYGCVAHIFSLQQQVLNLQAELAYIQAQLSTLQRFPLQPPPPPQLDASLDSASSSMEIMSTHFDPRPTSNVHDSTLPDDFDDDCELQALAHELISRYLSGARLRSPSSHH